MSSEPMSEFLDQLQASRLLSNDQMDELLNRPDPAHGAEYFLQEKGWLTNFQINEIREGRGNRLSFNGYRLVEKLADPLSGPIYKATHPALLEAVAFQWLNPAWLEPTDRLNDYLQRVQRISAISHPNLLNVLDAGHGHGTIYVVSEWVDSTDLGHLVREMGAVPVPLACEYARQAATGLQVVHERGLAHGDFSPFRMRLFPVIRKVRSNGSPQSVTVRPGPSATVKVADAAQIPLRPAVGDPTQSESYHPGAIGYMAPERLHQSGYDARQDIYSLGASLYYLLTGQSPLRSTSPSNWLVELPDNEPLPVQTLRDDVGPGLAQLIHRMLSKDPQQRPALAEEVAAALKPYCIYISAPLAPTPIPMASETTTGPVRSMTQPQFYDPEPELLLEAEALPGVEPLPETVSDSKVYSPGHPLPQRQNESHFADHDPFGGHSDESTPKPRPRPKPEKSDRGKTILLILLAIGLHLAAYTMLAWYIKFWPFNESEQPAPETPAPERKAPPKKKRSTTALERDLRLDRPWTNDRFRC